MTMKKFLYLLLVLHSGFFSLAQTGPAGVGTSATNVFWLKANSGTSSTTNNAPLSAWNDQSGNGLNMTQTVAAQQPSFVTNIINGFPAVQFDNSTSAGQNDKMLGPDSPLLDNTNGYSFFTVTRPMNLDGNARVLVSKRTTVSVDQSFMLFYYTGNNMYVDVQTVNDRFSSATAFSSSNNYIIDLIYDGTIANPRCSLYVGETFNIASNETSTSIPDNASPIILGTTDATDPRPYGGYMCEVIIYREALAPAKRIIVNNYLSAKYNIALASNDKYAGDNSGNGDYDLDVAGIGQESTGSNPSFSASISGGLGITATAGLDNTDYLLAGHAVAINSVITSDVSGLSGTNKARWARTWYLDITNTSTDISADMEFDLSDGGLPGSPGTASDYKLLYRAGQSGNWSEMAIASSVSGDRILFSNITFTADGYYTIGSINFFSSPLPIELNGFTATVAQDKVDLAWSTSSEKNNAYFSIEKSRDGIIFEAVQQVKGAGTSSTRKNYTGCDLHPYEGLSYYRLKQTDADLSSTYSPLVAVNFGKTEEGFAKIYPNPANGSIYVDLNGANQQDLFITLRDQTGKACFARGWPGGQYPSTLSLDVDRLNKGIYFISVVKGGRSFSQKIILK
jgi:hypothetical protein